MATMANNAPNRENWTMSRLKQFHQVPTMYFDGFDTMPENLHLLSPSIVNIVDNSQRRKSSITNFRSEEENSSILSVPEITQEKSRELSTHTIPTSSRPLDLICGVCGAPAHGYNFDQISCESCKAFFRRNALRHMPHLKCRFSGSCVITVQTRRQCTYCRLKKCFDIKMRKEWIRTEEERELRRLKNLMKQEKKMDHCTIDKPFLDIPIVVRKKKRLSTLKTTTSEQLPVSLDQSVVPYQQMNSPLNLCVVKFQDNLNEKDSSMLTNIAQAYEISTNRVDCSFISKYDRSAKFTQFINDESVVHASLIDFYKQIPEFQQLGIDDKTLLIKGNFTGIIHMHHIIVERFRENPHIGEHMSKWISPEFHKNMSKARVPFDRFMEHPLALQLALVMLLFTFNMSIPHCNHGPSNYVNKKHLYESQNVYATLLWRYLSYLYGEREAARSIQTIVMQVLRYQTLMVTLEEVIQKQNDIDQFDPLMLSVLQLT